MARVPVWLFVPNLIGYVRVITGIAAFAYAFSDAKVFFALYAFSYALDALDGVAARKLGQLSSFGAVLDMVTDRVCTAGLLAVLSRAVPSLSFIFYALLILDIGSHWVQMYRCGDVEGAWLPPLSQTRPALAANPAQLPGQRQHVAQGGAG